MPPGPPYRGYWWLPAAEALAICLSKSPGLLAQADTLPTLPKHWLWVQNVVSAGHTGACMLIAACLAPADSSCVLPVQTLSSSASRVAGESQPINQAA